MVKRFYFSKNSFNSDFYLDGGGFGKNREYLSFGKEKMMDYLRKGIDLKRKTAFHIEESVPVEFIEEIISLFKDSKIKVNLESKFD